MQRKEDVKRRQQRTNTTKSTGFGKRTNKSPFFRRRAGAAASTAAPSAQRRTNRPNSIDPKDENDTDNQPKEKLPSLDAVPHLAATQCKLHVHEFQAGADLTLNPEAFPALKHISWADYVVEIFHPTVKDNQKCDNDNKSENVHDSTKEDARQHLLLEIPENSAAPVKGKMQVSVLKDTASMFQLQPFEEVTVRFVAKSTVEVDFIEISLRDQFMSRRDLWYLTRSLYGSAVYVGKHIRLQGSRWQVLDMRSAGGQAVQSGVISHKTKFAFRSKTSRVTWLIQISPELWDLANSGRLYLEILIMVVRAVLEKWIKQKVSHSLTIIFFARSYYPDMDAKAHRSFGGGRDRASSFNSNTQHVNSMPSQPLTSTEQLQSDDDAFKSTFPYSDEETFAVGVDEDGRHYQDFYKGVTFDTLVTEVEPLLVTLKEELNGFPRACGWHSPSNFFTPKESGSLRGTPSKAQDGNLLEAINLVLNIFEKHHIDRHLARSGQSVVLMTAGNGIFSVNRRLSEITEQRMMDHGIGIDLISLATPPLHKCPLFLFKQSELGDMHLPSRSGDNSNADVCSHCGATLGKSTRKSRASSTDGVFDSQSVTDNYSSSMRCRFCRKKSSNARSRYVVPLWIPLSFVQEDMVEPHTCGLDTDITGYCDVCQPRTSHPKGFEPLPMCRMLQSGNSQRLPEPLEKLLNGFDTSAGDRDAEFFRKEPLSDLVRARTSSLVIMEDGAQVPHAARDHQPAPIDSQRLAEAFDRYDDQVFSFFRSNETKHSTRSSDGDNNGFQAVWTPPLRPSAPSSLKKRAGEASSSLQHVALDKALESLPRRSQDSLNNYVLDASSSSPLRSDRASGGSEGNLTLSDEDVYLPESIGSNRSRNATPHSSYALEHMGSQLPFTTSPILLPADGAGREELFYTRVSILRQLTSNQRRWSQLYPSDGTRYKQVQSVLKWKSLCFPALLPLTTDYSPSSQELQSHYTEAFYSVILPERDEHSGVTFRDYRELVIEMVAQRFSQDFQLVSHGHGGKEKVYRLSMGHRIHEIKYNDETQTIDVKRFLQKTAMKSDVDIMEYRYQLWSPIDSTFRSVSQEFRKYPRLEYAWNYLDQLVCGYYDEMSEAIRYKRILYCIIPPKARNDQQVDSDELQEYTDRVVKFLEHLRSKAESRDDVPRLKIPTGGPMSGIEAFKRLRQVNVKIPLQANDAPSGQNWVVLHLDTDLRSAQCFHVEVQWLVCRSALVEDFIGTLGRRAKQLNLDFLQVPEVGISNNLDLHPMVCPIFLPVRSTAEQKMVEEALVQKFGFVCEALHPIPFSHRNHDDEYAIVAQPASTSVTRRRVVHYYRQYIHRDLPCYARMTQTGLVWISTRKMMDGPVQQVYDGVRQEIEAVHAATNMLSHVLDQTWHQTHVEDGHSVS